ncbi:DUF397 domain-containing protein [Streptomyces sp. NBC_01261]
MPGCKPCRCPRIRDSKTPARATLTFPAGAFTPLREALRSESYSTVTDFARFRG